MLTSLQNPKVTLGFNRTDFVRSGWLDLPNTAGTFRDAGFNGHYWSSRMASNIWSSAGAGGYDLFVYTEVNPSWGPDARSIGVSLRCLSTVLDM